MSARVPLHGKPGAFVTIEPRATYGAVVGVNLYWPDGALVSSADFGGGAVAPQAIGSTRTAWSLVLEIPANVQAVAGLSGSGFVRRSALGAWSASAIANADLGGADTDGLAEGATNLYFTDARAQAALADDLALKADVEQPTFTGLVDAADDAAAAAAGVAVGQVYRNGSVLMIRVASGGGGGGGSDPSFSSVVALLHGNGTNGSTTITDSSSSAKTWTASGVTVSTAQSKFGGASLLFNGASGYITSASHADWAFGTGDFTVEAWVYWNAHTATGVMLSNYTNSTNGWWLRWNVAGYIEYGHGDTGLGSSGSGSFTPTNGQWYHIAWSRESSVNRIFVDGTQVGAGISAGTNMSSTAAIYGGRLGALAVQYFSGYLDDVRITKGVARYTANFTPPTAALPDS